MVFPNNGNVNRMLTSNQNTTNAFSQFDKWSREQESFVENTNKVHRERNKLEEEIVQLKLEQKHVTSQIRDCQDYLGRLHRERAILMEKKTKLQRSIKEERALLEKDALEENNLIDSSKNEKKRFCRDMEDLNDELSSLLLRQQLNSIRKLITIDSVHVLKEHYQKNVRSPTTFTNLSPDSFDCGDQNPDKVLERLDSAIESFIDADSSYKKSVEHRLHLIEEIKNHRERLFQDAMKDGRSLTMESLVQMEQWWQNSDVDHGSGNDESQIASENDESTKNDCHAMDIFYDASIDSEENLQFGTQPSDG